MGHIQYKYAHTKFLPLHFLIIGLLFGLVACSKVESPTVASSQAPQITLTSTKLPTPTATFTHISASATPTATFTPAGPTATPKIVPTLNVEQSQLAEDFIKGTEDCQLPCWHGIIPGISPPSAVPDFLEQLGLGYDPADVQTDEFGESRLILDYYGDYLDVALADVMIFWKGTTINRILIWAFPGSDNFINVHRVIEELGQPDSLELGFALNSGDQPFFSLLMIYQKHQIAISYQGLTKRTQDDELQMCINQIVQAWMYTEGEEPYRQYRLFVEADYWGDMSKYKITEAEFFEEIYSNSKNGTCVDVPQGTSSIGEPP